MTLLEAYTILRDNGIKPTSKRGTIGYALNCEHIGCDRCPMASKYTVTQMPEPCMVYVDNLPTEEELLTLKFQYEANK